MRDQLEYLARLQEIDDQLSALERSKGDYPERIEQLQEELSQRLGKQASENEHRSELEKERRRLERLLKDRNAQLEKEQARLSEVKTNKEWDAIQKEMDAVKSEIGEAEDELLEIIEQLENLNQSADAETEEFRNWRTQAEAEIDDLKEKLSKVDGRMSTIRSERDALTLRIDDRLKRIYNRIKQGKQGTAVVPVVRSACGGCYTRLPPQMLTEIRRAEKPITCENCGRLIIWFGEEEKS
jgi:predicted  nucleic acid-binding Zn-ribbon protein